MRKSAYGYIWTWFFWFLWFFWRAASDERSRAALNATDAASRRQTCISICTGEGGGKGKIRHQRHDWAPFAGPSMYWFG